MNTVDIRAEWIGQVVDGRFPLLQWIGGSEASAVFLTALPGPGSKNAAVKLVPINRGVDGDTDRGADSFNAQTYIAAWARSASLSHPNLVRLFHTGRCLVDGAEVLYGVMDYAEEVLSEILPTRPLTPGETREMLGPALDALSYLHGKRFVHGRLKPANILDVDDRLKISADRLYVSGEASQHFAPSVYDAPEISTQPISPAADIWSLGVTLVEVLTQQLPQWNKEQSGDPVVPRSIPEPFAGIARECLRRDPARRCTLDAVRTRLEAPGDIEAMQSIRTVAPFAELENPMVAHRSAMTEDSEDTGSKPWRVGTMLIVAAVVLVLILAGLFLRSRSLQPSPEAGNQPEAPAARESSPRLPIPVPAAKPHSARGLAQKGAVARQVLPDVPQFASRTIQGKVNVEVRLTADANGDVSNAALASPGPSKYFANLALEAARKWKFKPARVGGRNVPGEWTLRFRFTRGEVTVTPTDVSR